MHSFLKQSTASQTRIVGPFIDDTDFKTTETGLTIANTDVKLSKNGAAAANKNSGGGTHIANGMYALTFDATDTATVGELNVSILMSGALVVVAKFTVLEEAIYDALFASSATGFDSSGRVNVGKWLGTAVTTNATTSKPEVDVFAISGDSTAANNAESAFDGTGYNVGNGSIVAASVTGAVGSVTGNVGGNVTGSIGSLGTTAKTDVNTQVDTALADIGLDHLVSASVTGSDITDNSIVAKLVSSSATADWDNYDNTTDSLEAIAAASGGSAPTAGEIADAVWDEATSGHTTAGTFGKAAADILADTDELQTDDVPGLIAALNDISAADVNAQCDAAIETYGLDHLVSAAVVGADVTDNSIIAKLVSDSATADFDDYDNTTDSLPALQADIAALPSTTIIPILEPCLTSTAGTTVNLRIVCVDQSGARVDLSGYETAVASVTVTEFGSGSPLFTQAFVIGDINNNGFEAQKSSPGFTSDRHYVVSGSVTLDGTAYTFPDKTFAVFG